MDQMKIAATPLHGRLDRSWEAEPIVLRITTDPTESEKAKHALLLDAKADDVPKGFACCLYRIDPGQAANVRNHEFRLPEPLSYLQEGDVVRVNPRRGEVWVMYRKDSPSNAMLLTERCNSWCVMCSQPPKKNEDQALVRAWLDAIPLMDPGTKEIGITGGEPTLLANEFLKIVGLIREHLPQTALHVLSNGRMFNYLTLATALAEVAPADSMIGIPLYSDIAWQHDFVVQASNAFDQTIRGVMNLARCRVPVEIRVVLHRHTVPRLRHLAAFITRNLPFVQHLAIMGLEPIGFGQTNFDALWADPVDYQEELAAAVDTLVCHDMNVSIYNHQLCVLPQRLWRFSRKSISDWKTIYLPACTSCVVREDCGGFFHSAIMRHSRAVAPVQDLFPSPV